MRVIEDVCYNIAEKRPHQRLRVECLASDVAVWAAPSPESDVLCRLHHDDEIEVSLVPVTEAGLESSYFTLLNGLVGIIKRVVVPTPSLTSIYKQGIC